MKPHGRELALSSHASSVERFCDRRRAEMSLGRERLRQRNQRREKQPWIVFVTDVRRFAGPEIFRLRSVILSQAHRIEQRSCRTDELPPMHTLAQWSVA